MKSKGIIITAIICSFIVSLFFYLKEDTSVIKFFPIDDSLFFSSFGTELTLISETDQDEYDLEWKAFSGLQEPIYLRQDVTLLYSDGRLKGILNKWKENEQNIELASSIHGEDSSHYQAISFHHGEIHYPDDKIKSIQTMSQDELYVIDSPHSALESFEQPTDSNQKEWKETLDRATNQQLSYHWRELMKHFQIPHEQYTLTPLTELYQYNEKPIPALNQQDSMRVIGQLWEGLYKNYILPVSNHNKPVKSFVPLILFDNKGKHLIVLFQDKNGQKQQLIQYYSSANNRS